MGVEKKKSREEAAHTHTHTHIVVGVHSHRYPTRHSLRLRTAASLSPPSPESQLVRGAEQNTILAAACRKRSTRTEAKHRIINGGKRRKREVQTPAPYLPIDMIFEILLLLPAKLLYEVMRYVCWEWYNIVDDPAFITAHLQMSSSSKGFLFQQSGNKESAYYYYVKRSSGGSDLEVTELRIPFRGNICGACNGLVLLYDLVNHPRVFHIANPVTGLVVSLPPVVRGRIPCGIQSALTTCTSSGGCCFKVVCVARESDTRAGAQVMIFTVGVDKTWRLINHADDDILMSPTVVEVLSGSALVVAGFVYWIHIRHWLGFAMDVDAETMYQLTLPETGQFKIYDVQKLVYEETSLSLSMYVWERRRLEFWNLADVKSCKWVNIMVIDEATILDNKLWKTFRPFAVHYFLKPFYLKNEDLWMKIQDTGGIHVVCYNLKTGNFLLSPYSGIPWCHFNSLVSVKI